MAYGYPLPPPQQRSSSATVVIVVVAVLGILVFGVCILAVLAIFGTSKYLSAAKGAEATNTVGQLQKLAAQAYEREAPSDNVTPGAAALIEHRLCPSASRPVPSSVTDVAAKKYMAAPAEWLTDEKTNAGFACLKFEMMSPQYYQYDYKATASSFTAIAHGDLDGDGTLSTFEGSGKLDSATQTVTASPLVMKNQDE